MKRSVAGRALGLCLLCVALFWNRAVGQTDSDVSLPKVILPSPNAAALGKYGDIPVNYHTGVPSISIPLYEVKEGSISLPVSLNYHASGIRVSEAASWVGLGWSLNAGGVITRTIQHVADEGPARYSRGSSTYWVGPTVKGNFRTGYYKDGYIFPSISPYRAGSSWTWIVQEDGSGAFGYADSEDATRENMYIDAASGNLDCEPDLFFFNFGGYSGKFIFRVDTTEQGQLVRTPVFMPRADVKVEVSFGDAPVPLHFGTATEARPSFISFVITTPDGMKYTFGGASATEYSGTESYRGGSSDDFRNDPTKYEGSHPVIFYASSWHLTRIEAPDGKFITLEYEKDRYSFFDIAPERVTGGVNAALSHQAIMRTAISGVKLKNITNSTSRVLFHANTLREDLGQFTNIGGTEAVNNQVETKRLDSIQIKPLNGDPVKVYELGYGYFVTATDNGKFLASMQDTDRQYYTTDLKRLKLLSVTEKAGDGSAAKPPHRFFYNETPLPRRISFQQDYWGYFNGAFNNTTLIAFGAPPYNPVRKPDSVYMQAGILTEIKYPTGGSTTFAYEPHEYEGYEQTVAEFPYTLYSAATTYSVDDPDNIVETPIELKYAPPSPGSLCDQSNETSGCNEFKIYVTISAGHPYSSQNAPYYLGYSGYEDSDDLLVCILTESGSFVSGSYFSPGELGKIGTSACPENNQCSSSSSTNFKSITQSFIVTLPPGKYRLQARRIRGTKIDTDGISKTVLYTSSISVRVPAESDVNYQETVKLGRYKAGGLRIAKITDKDGMVPENTVEKKYTYPDAGILFSRPVYFFEPQWLSDEVKQYPPGNTLGQIWSSASILPMQTSQGAHIGYKKVRVAQTGNGYSEYEYDTRTRPYPVVADAYYTGTPEGGYASSDRYVNYPPYPPTHFYERGNLIRESHYNKDGKIISSKDNEYESSNVQAMPGLRATKIEFVQNMLGTGYPSPTHYPTFTGISRLLKTTETAYDMNGSNKVITITDYAYESQAHMQVTKTTRTAATGQIVEKMVYPPDYGVLPDLRAGIKSLQARNLIAVPIEKYTIRQNADGTNAEIIGGVITTFKPDKLLLDQVKVLETASPIPLGGFNHSNQVNNSFVADDRYKTRLLYHSYDATGNVREVSKSGDIWTVYLWGYNSAFPVAEIKNATYSDVKTALGIAADADLDLGAGGLNSTQITALRTHELLKDAMITTFTYDPLKGMTSQTGPDGVTLTYEYDDLGRLVRVKDHLGNLVKHYEYHYKQ